MHILEEVEVDSGDEIGVKAEEETFIGAEVDEDVHIMFSPPSAVVVDDGDDEDALDSFII